MMEGLALLFERSVEVVVVIRDTGGIGKISEFERSCRGFNLSVFHSRLLLSSTLLIFASTPYFQHGHVQS